jgi:hypothetical protein
MAHDADSIALASIEEHSKAATPVTIHVRPGFYSIKLAQEPETARERYRRRPRCRKLGEDFQPPLWRITALGAHFVVHVVTFCHAVTRQTAVGVPLRRPHRAMQAERRFTLQRTSWLRTVANDVIVGAG